MIYNINKPENWTSFDVVKKVRSITKERKVGHAGTLDPFATGVLVIGTGADTKKLSQVTEAAKEYFATMELGKQTSTLDTEGEIVKTASIPKDCSVERIVEVLSSFVGDTLQTPPMFSAKKVNGKKLYELARKNIEIKRKPVPITIFSIELDELNLPYLSFSVTCAKGTYIRVLACDIAAKLETCGYLTSLTRTRIGNFDLENSMTLTEFENKWSYIEA